MAKTATYSTVQNITQVIRYNEPTSIAGVDAQGQPTNTPAFYPASIVCNMQAVADDGGLRDVQTVTPVGTPRATAYTPQELYALIKGTTTGAALAAPLKAAYADAIGTVVA